MIIVINGTVGVGKTCIGGVLNDNLTNSIFIDGDAFYEHSNLNHESLNWYENWLEIICTNINVHFTKFKTKNFVISYVFENNQQILQFVNAIKSYTQCNNAAIYFFLLGADMNIIKQRIEKRSKYYNDDNDSLNGELKRSIELNDILLNGHNKQLHSLGQLIDTSNCEDVGSMTKQEFLCRKNAAVEPDLNEILFINYLNNL